SRRSNRCRDWWERLAEAVVANRLRFSYCLPGISFISWSRDMADQKPNGLFITDDAGNVYYLRPEILAQAKMPDEDVKKLKDELAANSKGQDQELSLEDLNTVAGGVNFPAATHVHVGASFSALNHLATHSSGIPNIGNVMTSTVMCPW